MPDAKTYTGGCHCGAVRYRVTASLDKVISCNCSICAKRGSLLAFAAADQFSLLSGDGDLADYQFNKKIIHHQFCRKCGIGSFARGTAPNGAEMVAINVRCLDDIDLATLTPTPFDGKSL
ncbi:MAG TPA: GFA family protein [Stellaceae bacterium]|jgi:hypothetical protein|nr:GFA family protein [Stellaceae bacterium]